MAHVLYNDQPPYPRNASTDKLGVPLGGHTKGVFAATAEGCAAFRLTGNLIDLPDCL